MWTIVRSGDSVEKLEELLVLYPNYVKRQNKFHENPIHVAAKNGHTHIVELLIKFGGELYRQDIHGHLSIHGAAFHGHAETVEVLVRACPSIIDRYTGGGYFAMHIAAARGHASVVETLVRLGSQTIDSPNDLMQTPMDLALSGDYPEVIELLVRLGSRSLCTLYIIGVWRYYERYSSKALRTVFSLNGPAPSGSEQLEFQERIDEEFIVETRWRVYFMQSLVNRLLFALECQRFSSIKRIS